MRRILSAYQRIAYRIFGPTAARAAPANPRLRAALQKAHIGLRPEVYLSTAYLNMLMASVLSAAFLGILAVLQVAGVIRLAVTTFYLLMPLPIVLAATIYLIAFTLPDLRSGTRARDVDVKLPFALNYIATMASAGISLDRILESLATKGVYGEVANEAAWISRDIKYLGLDIVSALGAAVDRSPSRKFQDLLQGVIVTLTAGGNLKTYFRSKSDQFAYENRQEQKKFLETLGVLAESFVTVVVAAPLFLLVLLSVMSMFGGSAQSMLSNGYILIFVLLPMAQMAFIMTIKSMAREG